jgi:hypothetical protein
VVTVDLDDTANCPKAAVCGSCGATGDLEVATMGTPVGVLCGTLCTTCLDGARVPKPPSWSAAIDAVFAHCVTSESTPTRWRRSWPTRRGRP